MQKNKLMVATPENLLAHINTILVHNKRAGAPAAITLPSLKVRARMIAGTPTLVPISNEVKK